MSVYLSDRRRGVSLQCWLDSQIGKRSWLETIIGQTGKQTLLEDENVHDH